MVLCLWQNMTALSAETVWTVPISVYSGKALSGPGQALTFGIDTGCVYGQSLTGLLLPGRELISVPAREDHWARLQREWAGRLQAAR